MPIVSRAQRRLMGAIASGAKPRKGKGPSRKVAEEFLKASRGIKDRQLPERKAKR